MNTSNPPPVVIDENDYINIDGGINVPSSWPNVLPSSDTYLDITKITMEIPIPVSSVSPYASLSTAQIEEYWTSEPKYKTKLASHNVFRSSFMRYANTLSIFVNGIQLTDQSKFSIIDNLYFSISPSVPDGYISISYYPLFGSSSYPFGNVGSTLVASYKRMKTDHKLPEFDTSLIVRMRSVINNIEAYYKIAPSVWLGGFDNEFLSTARNIVPHITPISADHITELQYAIKRLIRYMEGKIPSADSISNFKSLSFTSVGDSDYLHINVLNEITYALTKIEAETITIFAESQ